MARVFLLTSDTGASGATSALLSAIRHIPPEQHQFSGLELGGPNPFRFPSIKFDSLLNLKNWRTVRSAIGEFAPDVIHLVGNGALRLAEGLGRKFRYATSGIQPDELGSLGKRAIRNSGTAITHSLIEAGTHFIPFGVESPAPSTARPATKLPAEARIILFGGNLDAASHPIQAAWAFDVLKYVDPRLHLVFVGDGPLKSQVQQLAYSLGFDDYRVHFALSQDELPYWRSRAELVWLTQTVGGAMPTLESLVHELPVIAMQTPELAEYCKEAEGVILVPPGDRVALASATKKLLEGPRPNIPMPRFPLEAMVEGYISLYDALAGKTGSDDAKSYWRIRGV
jgi:glycosyltransferase involved in cell wall biosynthesis